MSALPHSVHVHCRDLTRGREQSGNTSGQSSASHRDTLKQNNSYTAELQRREQAMDMGCYRKILRISYKDHNTIEEVRAKIKQAIGSHENLLTIVKRRKLQWYGHISRSSGPAKTILQGTVKVGRRKGRQRKRWEDNKREWTDLEFDKKKYI